MRIVCLVYFVQVCLYYGIFLTKTYSIEDCSRYDDASTDKTSNYSYDNLTSLTHSTDHYEAVRTITGDATNYYSPIYIDESLPSDYEISVDVNCTNVADGQTMLTVSPNHPSTYSGASEIGIVSTSVRYGLFKRISGAFTSYATSGSLSNNAWYKFIVKVEGTSVTGKILNSQGTEIHSSTQTISEVTGYNKWNIVCGYLANTLKFKNLKIKPL